uniref:DUF3426 domain-containing protein n=1 Tax=uncultured Thiotrichaceae bacterium TaxID=298394 RepID=A0A6S6SZ20_9GAMM|nr:MAG: Unknown protein [uncultured Thiotrichaceae bacterium]
MKELTAAQGLLRCGECDTIFDAMKALSTALPEERDFSNAELQSPMGEQERPTDTRIRVLPANQHSHSQTSSNTDKQALAPRSRKFLIVSLSALALLLLLQLLYSTRDWFAEQPLTAKISQSVCATIGCEVKPPRSVDKITMLSHSVYSHPNSPKLLIISASIQNNATFEQPYPLLEISFLNSDSEVVALRRFTPEEYIGEMRSEKLMPNGLPEEFSVNIADPGTDAVRFQFRFL